MLVLLWLIMYVAIIFAALYLFGAFKNTPVRLKIIFGIFLLLDMLSMIGMSMGY